jgi:hypothetical protein
MRIERGTVWDAQRINTARVLLGSGYGRAAVAARLGLTRAGLKQAIQRFNLEPPRPKGLGHVRD